MHTTDGEYIVTNIGNIYDDNERDKISGDETIYYDGYKFNKMQVVIMKNHLLSN